MFLLAEKVYLYIPMSIKLFKSSQIGNLVKKIIPPLTSKLHKGQAGRIGIIGGCQLYTGAPFYAGISVLKTGGDLSFVFCTQSASIMKTYSPELIIYPILPEGDQKNEKIIQDFTDKGFIERIHTFVIGPGLGRDKTTFQAVQELITEMKKSKKNLILDGDMLYLISNFPDLIKGYSKAILTPNHNEYTRLIENILSSEEKKEKDEMIKLNNLCKALGNVIIIKKGETDLICNGKDVIYEVDEEGTYRRCGGQGDILAGVLGVFSHWGSIHKDDLGHDSDILSCLGGCILTRASARNAFNKNKRGTTTPDIINCIAETFDKTFEL